MKGDYTGDIKDIKVLYQDNLNEKLDNTQLALLKYAYKDIKRINPSEPAYGRLVKHLDTLSKSELQQLADAGINFISLLAKNRLMRSESVDEALSVDPRKVYGGTGAKEGMVLVKQDGFKKILDLSKKNPSNVFIVSDDNYTNFGPFYVKNGKVAKYTVANPNYDLEKNKVRTVKVPSDVILKFKVVESVNEAVPTQTKWAVAIASLTATRPDAVQKFIDDNNLNSEKLHSYIKKGKLSDRMDFVTALAGKPGNPIQKKMIKMFK